MKNVPTIETLELLAESDQQLFSYIVADIGIICLEHKHDSTSNTVDPLMVESVSSELIELDDYRSAAKRIAESLGYKVSIDESLIEEELVINEVMGFVRSAYNIASNVLRTIASWLVTAAELAIPLFAIALGNNRRFSSSERIAQHNTNVAVAEFLIIICDEPEYSGYLQPLERVITSYLQGKYAAEGKGRQVANINVRTLYGYNEYKQSIDRIIKSGKSATVKGLTGSKKTQAARMAEERIDVFIVGAILEGIRKNKIYDADGSLASVLRPFYDTEKRKYDDDLRTIAAGP